MHSIVKSLVFILALMYPTASLAAPLAPSDPTPCLAVGAACTQIGGVLEVQCCGPVGYVICGAGETFDYFHCPEGTTCQIPEGIEPVYCA
jgi:hypothetical protein